MTVIDLARVVREKMLGETFVHVWVKGTRGNFDNSGIGGFRVIVTVDPMHAWLSNNSSLCWVGYFNRDCELAYLTECLAEAEKELTQRFARLS
jgi:hypothetical protein